MVTVLLRDVDLTYYPVVPLSLVLFLIIYLVFAPKVSSCYVKEYNKITASENIIWCKEFTSFTHAILVSLSSLYVLLFDQASNSDLIWANSPLIFTNGAFVTGYMIADLIINTLNRAIIPGFVPFVLHHLACIWGYVVVMSYHSLGWFANTRLLAEFSTPFLCMKFFLETVGFKKTSSTFVLNGLLFTIMFFVFRIAIMPWYYYNIYCIYGTDGYMKLGNISYLLYILSIALDIINIYWFRKIIEGCIKLLKGQSNRETTEVV